MDAVATRWKECLMEVVTRTPDLPLLLSGGMDSATILAALLELGERPTCYTFQLDDRPSPDRETATRMCADHGLTLRVAELPTDPDSVAADVREVLRMMGTSRKTSVQCTVPILHLTRLLCDDWGGRDGYRGAFVGTGGIVEDSRRLQVALAQDGEDAVRGMREEGIDGRHRDTATGRIHQVAALQGVTLHEPYSEEPLRSYALSLDVAELNRPRQKGIALRAFPDFFRADYHRKNSALQVASGLRELHDEVFLAPERNPEGHQRVVAVYNRMLEEEKGERLAI